MNSMFKFFWLLFVSIIFLLGCKKEKATDSSKQYSFNFQANAEGWSGDFADYPSAADQRPIYNLQFSHTMLPNPLSNSDGALRQSGTNRSDDLFMFVRKKIEGLEPNIIYAISFEIEIATNAPSGNVGVGGAPGESVYIKAGATTIKPEKQIDTISKHFKMNVDKGNQSTDGPTIKLIGDFANGTTSNAYNLKKLISRPLNTSIPQCYQGFV